jgi:lipopolysaccharide export system protein LptA
MDFLSFLRGRPAPVKTPGLGDRGACPNAPGFIRRDLFPKKSLSFAGFPGLVFLASFFGTAVFLSAFEIKKDQQVSSKKPVNISSHQLTFERPEGLTLFTGDVKATHDKIILLSDEIHAMEGNREATANGHVSVVDSSQGITLTCGNLEYQDLMNLMTAHDHPVLTTLDENGHPITITGRQMEVDSEKKTVVINQNVQIIHKEGHAEAQKATFLSGSDKFVLEEDPKVYTENGLLSGRRIVSSMGGLDRNVFVEGMADAIFNPNGKPVTTPSTKKGGLAGPGTSATPGTAGPGTAGGPSAPVTNGNGLGNNGPAAPINPGTLPRSGPN